MVPSAIVPNADTCLLIESSQKPEKMSIINLPISHMRKLKYRHIKKFAQVHLERKF